jgi:hypothetical protein
MRSFYLLSLLIILHATASAQFVAKMEIKDSIPGLCDKNEVYALFPMFKGQEEAPCPMNNTEIQARLEEEVVFLKKNANYKDKGMVNIIINCKGEVVKCEMDNKTKSEELDKQIVDVFKTLGTWKPGKLNGKPVDSSRLWSFDIKKGKIYLQ